MKKMTPNDVTQSQQSEFQKKLRDEFVRMKLKNPSYSLRAFAKRLGIEASPLSAIVNGKRRVSRQYAEKLLRRLSLNPIEIRKVISASGYETDQSGITSQYMQLAANTFNVIADWYHFAILSLAETNGFISKTEWIAKRLGISNSLAEGAVSRLIRLNMLRQDSHGGLHVTGQQYITTDGVESDAIRLGHRQNLEIAAAALDGGKMEDRDFVDITFAASPRMVATAKQEIRNFLASLSDRLEAGEKEEVYRICVQTLRLSKSIEGN